MKHGKHGPFVKDSTHHHTNIYQPSPENHLRSWKVCFVIRGISHVSSPCWAVDINLTWSWNLDLVKIHGFFFEVLWGWKVLQLVRIGMTWLVASWISCMFTGRFEWIREGCICCMASSCVTSWIKWPHDVSCSLHLGVHRKLLEDMDRRLGPSVTWCRKGSQGTRDGWLNYLGRKIWDSLDLCCSQDAFLLISNEAKVRIEDLPLDTMLSGIGASEVITYSAAMNSLSKTGDWAMATGLLRQLDAELSMNEKDMMTLRETAW